MFNFKLYVLYFQDLMEANDEHNINRIIRAKNEIDYHMRRIDRRKAEFRHVLSSEMMYLDTGSSNYKHYI